MTEKWILMNKKADFAALEREMGIDPLTARLLANRGVDTPEKARLYLQGSLADLRDPALLKDAGKTAAYLKTAVEAGDSVAIASDFDADGIFSGFILKTALRRLGARVKVFTPDRVSEGYGLNRRIVEEARDFGAKLLLTCDNGISAVEPVAYAKSLGMTVLITDHHETPRDGLPAADAIVDPKQEDCGYPFPGICGAVVALKVMQLLYERMGRSAAELDDLVAYGAIATVTDVMELQDENRILVKEGLKRLEQSDNPGMRTLIRLSGLEGKSLTAYHLGFILGPCFNAAGRLETVEIVEKLLESGSEAEALPYAEKLQELNNIRKSLTGEGRAAAEKTIAQEGLEGDAVLVVYLPEVHESVAGIIAGRLKEIYHRPALVITGSGEEVKGSGRSVEAYNMYEGLDRVKALLLRFGGHPMAAGFSLLKENIPALREALNAQAGLTEEDLSPKIRLDAVMKPGYATEERIREWESLAPFGKGNEKPLFGASKLNVTEVRVLGQNRNAVRLRFSDESGISYEGIWFGEADAFAAYITEEFGEKAWTALERRQKPVQLALTFEPMVHEWNDRRSIQFQIRNFRAVH